MDHLPNLWRRTKFLAAALLCGLGICSAVYLLRPVGVSGQPGVSISGGKDPVAEAPKAQPIFIGWDKPAPPALAIVVSGQGHGYLQPCGCSRPQIGGLPRRYNFLESLRKKGWPIMAVDIGEIAQSHGPQSLLKYEFSMRALREMGYAAMGIGRTEFDTPVAEALSRWSLNNPAPALLATNLIDNKGDFQQLGAHKFKILTVASKEKLPSLGIFSVVDAATAKKITDPSCKFDPAAKALADVMQTNRGSINILIYQGTDSNEEVGKFITALNALRLQNKNIPHVPIILCLTPDPEPPQNVKVMAGISVISVGWKGRYVGVIGLFHNAKTGGFETKYQLVPMSEDYEAPDNPINQLMEEYAKKVKDGKYIEKFPRSPHPMQVELNRLKLPTEYVGSNECQRCHANEYAIWEKSKHSHAFKSLEKAKNPSLRQFDGECVVCHTVGFHYSKGYLSPGNEPVTNELLKNVGCENCHGPGAAHLANRRNPVVHELMNPYSTTKRIPASEAGDPSRLAAWKHRQSRKQDDFCQKCHDQENDVHYKFDKYWPHVEHYRAAAGAAPGGAPAINVGPGAALEAPNGFEIRPGDKR